MKILLSYISKLRLQRRRFISVVIDNFLEGFNIFRLILRNDSAQSLSEVRNLIILKGALTILYLDYSNIYFLGWQKMITHTPKHLFPAQVKIGDK